MLVTVPAGIRFEDVHWDIDVPQQRNLSKWTGRSKVIGLPGAEKWYATGRIVPLARELDVRLWRAFLTSLRGAENNFRLPALPSQQTAQANPSVTVTYAGNASVNLSSVAGLSPGMLMTIPLPSGHERLVTIRAIVGARVDFEPPLPETPAAVVVEIRNPWCLMSLSKPRNGWTDANGLVSINIEAEEDL